METKTKIEEKKIAVLERCPPGDRWTPIHERSDTIFDSLTEALEFWFQKTGDTEFYISSRDGIVEIVESNEVEIKPQIKSYSLYGEE